MTVTGFTNYDGVWWHFTFRLPLEMRFDLPIS
jgi:D-alanyl-D-alanine dipeptidase